MQSVRYYHAVAATNPYKSGTGEGFYSGVKGIKKMLPFQLLVTRNRRRVD